MSITLQDMRDATDQLSAARCVMGQLRDLFAAISKLGSDDAAALALIGKGMADDWANVLDVAVEDFGALLTSPAASAASGRSGGDAYDDATLALERAQVLVCLLMSAPTNGVAPGVQQRSIAHIHEALCDAKDAVSLAQYQGGAQ